MRSRLRADLRSALLAGVLIAVVSGGGRASAQEERSDARVAYDDAAKAYEARDFARAAAGFARADALAPNALALKLALAAAVQADEPALAEELAIRAERRDASPDVQELARNAHRLAKGRVGRLVIACAAPPTCVAEVGDRKLRPGETMVVLPGPAHVVFTSESGRTSRVTVDVSVTETTLASEPRPSPLAPARADAPSRPRAGGMSPVVFWLGVGTSVALVGGTIASGIDANARYDDFSSSRTLGARDAGQSAELRTNILLGSAIVVALATSAVGLWFTRWGASDVADR